MDRKFLVGGSRVSWGAIVELFKQEKGKKCHAAPKLSERHIYPNNWDKMTVSLATQIFSATVSAALKTGFKASTLRHPNCLATADFVHHMNDLFDCLNAKSANDRNPLRRGISNSSNAQKIIEDSLGWVNTWEYADNKRVLPPSIIGLRLSLNSINLLAQDLLQGGQLYLLTSRLNQDAIENLFGTLRRRSGNNNNPSSMQFRHNLQYCIIAGLMSSPKGSNCIDDGDSALDIFSKKYQNIPQVSNINNDLSEDLTELLFEDENSLDGLSDDQFITELPIPNLEFCAVFYVAGFLLNRRMKTFQCQRCNKILTNNEDKLTDNTKLLIFF